MKSANFFLPVLSANNTTARPNSAKKKGNFADSHDICSIAAVPFVSDEETVKKLENADIFSCNDDEFMQLLDKLKEVANVSSMPQLMKKRPGKRLTKREMAKLQDEISYHMSFLTLGKTLMKKFIDDVNDRLSNVRREEFLLYDYYRTLDQDISNGDKEWLPKADAYHLKQRSLLRKVPLHNYLIEKSFLEKRCAKLQDLWQEMNMKERILGFGSGDGADSFESNASYDIVGTKDAKLGMYADAAGDNGGGVVECSDNNPVTRLRLQKMIRNMRMLCVPPPEPHNVRSKLRKSFILPFSARVLALEEEDNNNAGERFLEWYVSTVIDPLAMAQLVELVPREYLVRTTVRLFRACDSCVDSKRAQYLPDVLHVILEAIAKGDSEAFASLVLSPSNLYMRVPSNKEHLAVIFFAALITGHMESLRRLMFLGFYNVNALIVWLFLNPNSSDSGYKNYLENIWKPLKKYFEKAMQLSQGVFGKCGQFSFLAESNQFLSNLEQNENDGSFSSLHCRCDILRRFVCERNRSKQHISDDSSVISPLSTSVINEVVNPCCDNSVSNISSCFQSEKIQRQFSDFSTIHQAAKTAVESIDGTYVSLPHADDECSEITFSAILQKKKLDILCLSPIRCSVLPAASTSFVRRVDACGYTPLKATTSHFFLVGDTSTANAHIVRLPLQHMDMWPDDDPNEAPRLRVQRVKREKVQINNGKGQRFYYEAHISLSFLLNGVPLSEELFNPKLYQAAYSLSEKNDFYKPLQTSNVFVGWCSEECVPLADGRSPCPPLGSDCQSIGISFDVLHRAKINAFTDEVILRPRRHTMGRSSFYNAVEGVLEKERTTEEVNESCAEEKNDDKGYSFLLLRLFLEEVVEVPCDSSEFQGSKNTLSPVQAEEKTFQDSFRSDSSCLYASKKNDRKSRVSAVEFVNVNTLEKSKCQKFAFFENSFTTVKGLPVYDLQALVVGCHVNIETQNASFTVNGMSLGTAFTVLPSKIALRPAVSIQSSVQMAEILQHVSLVDSVIVRFVFEEAYMLMPAKASKGFFDYGYKNPLQCDKSKINNKLSDVEEVENKSIPGLSPFASPILFDKKMAICAFFRLLTCVESAASFADCDYDEPLEGTVETLSLGTTMRVTEVCVRQLLNTRCDRESMLFFPPVYIRSRSDNPISELNRVAIILENASLTPLCVALAQRQRIPAYHIALHPFTDFQKIDEASIMQRRMALRGAAALGYVEVLYVLLERLFVFEVLATFGLSISSDHVDYMSTGKKLRLFHKDVCRQISSVTTIQRLEYTPLHCAILEGHHECVHLLLYYLNRLLPCDYRQHAVNILTRSGETALIMACRLGYTKVAKRLIAIGASPSAFDRVTRSNCLELACASRSEEIAMALLQTSEYRFSVAVNLAGVASPLCWCALYNIGSLVRPLIMNGADLNVTLDGLTPLLLAVTFGSTEAALELLDCCEAKTSVQLSLTSPGTSSLPKFCLQRRKTAVSTAVQDCDGRCIALIDLDKLDPLTHCSALHLACELGQLKVATALIEKGASLSLQNKTRYANPLHVAIMYGNEKIALEILEYAKGKLRRGINVLDIAAIEKEGNTALHLAAQMGMLQVIEYIISQFSDEEMTRLCSIRNFAKKPNFSSLTATNKLNRTPLLVAIYAHQEAAAQLIASLMPDFLPNPGGIVVNGTCTAILASDAEGLDNLTLFFLSQPGYAAQETFREDFFLRYNAKRREIDLKEDAGSGEEEHLIPTMTSMTTELGAWKRGTQVSLAVYSLTNNGKTLKELNRRASTLRVRTSIVPASHAKRLGNTTGVRRSSLIRLLNGSQMPFKTPNQRRCSTFMQMLLAQGGTGFVTRSSFNLLKKGFPVEELYAMLDVICLETTPKMQSANAVLYAETIVCFLHEYDSVYVSSRDAVMFARQLRGNSQFLVGSELMEAKKRLSEMRPLCRDIFFILRTRGKHNECIEDIHHMITLRGLFGAALTEELTSPFGITAFQLAATLRLATVCQFFYNVQGMDPLYVPPKANRFCRASKWLLTPFRLALRSLDLSTVQSFITTGLAQEDINRLLEHKELLEADVLQQTALQELVAMKLCTFNEQSTKQVLELITLLISNGAVVQGNFDAEGNDAWMLAIRASPGKGIQLSLFLDQNASFEVDDNDECSASDDQDNLSIIKESSKQKNTRADCKDQENNEKGEEEEEGTVFSVTRKENRGLFCSLLTNDNDDDDDVQQTASVSDKKTLCDVVDSPWNVSPILFIGEARKLFINLKQKTYFAQLIFLCAEYNPQCLVRLLNEYPDVFLLSATHPVTGDSLLFFLLNRAASIYCNECCNGEFFSFETGKEAPLNMSSRIVTGVEKTTDVETAPYRDPLTIPDVRFLLIVVEKLLRNFQFSNLYYMRSDGQTALLLAACLSHNTIVSLIVRQGTSHVSGTVSSRETSKDVGSSKSGYIGCKSVVSGHMYVVNSQLAMNLDSLGCWRALATRIYYTEQEMDTLLIILDHLKDINVKYSFLSLVYSNLHPIVALRIAVLYAKEAKLFLIQPEPVNAFWSSVLYAQYVGRLEEVVATSAQWNLLLSLLIPTAPAVPLYLIKTTSLLHQSPLMESSTATAKVTGLVGTVDVITHEENEMKKRKRTTWKFFLTKIKQYVRQLVVAAICTASPPAAVMAAHGGGNGGVIPSSQRNLLGAMAAHFHELVELAVRFDNCALFKELMNMAPDNFQSLIKYEWRALMEKCDIVVTAVAAGSVEILRFLVDNSVTSPYFQRDRYDRIDLVTGLCEDALFTDDITTTSGATATNAETLQSLQQGALSSTTTSTKRGVMNNSFSTLSLPKSLSRAPLLRESKATTKKTVENKHTVVNLLLLDSSSTAANTDSVLNDDLNDDEQSESTLHYADIMAAARERLPVSAVTWGVGAAARPIALHGGSKQTAAWLTSVQNASSFLLPEAPKKTGEVVNGGAAKGQTPRVNKDMALSRAAGKRKLPTASKTQKIAFLEPRTTTLNEQVEQPSYFAFYLCDWALHTTLLLHTPRPSLKTIDTLLFLMDQRAPITASVVYFFFAASRPLNNWTSSDGQHITLNYVTRTHMDSLLHLLVQSNQLELTRYFLAAALCYFVRYQYDLPAAMPPNFSLLEMPETGKNGKFDEEEIKTKRFLQEENELVDDDGVYPAVFLRSMLRVNKHGLAPFDYAQGPMVALLAEYGCIPPSYRPNPWGFCRAIRLQAKNSTFQPVPRLLLVSHNFLDLRDEGKKKKHKEVPNTLPNSVTDSVLVRNQAISQRITRSEVLPSLLTDNVSLLHLGLCSADDELVLRRINEKRQNQKNIIIEEQTKDTAVPSSMTKQPVSVQEQRNLKRVELVGLTSLSSTPILQTPNSRGKNDPLPSPILKLLDALNERRFVFFPLLLSLDDDTNRQSDSSAAGNEGTAILISMTLMTLAQHAGVVKREECPPPPQKKWNYKANETNKTNPTTSLQSKVPPRFTRVVGKTAHSAELLESWVTSRRTVKQNTSGKDVHTNLLAKALGTSIAGRTVRSIGLSVAPHYEQP